MVCSGQQTFQITYMTLASKSVSHVFKIGVIARSVNFSFDLWSSSAQGLTLVFRRHLRFQITDSFFESKANVTSN